VGTPQIATPAIRVAVVEDIPLFRQMIIQSIEGHPALELVAATAGVSEARTVIPPAAPDVLLLDLHLPDGSGFKLGLELRGRLPQLRVIVLSEHVRPQVLHSLATEEKGHWSYLIKANVASPRALGDAVLAASQHSIVDPEVRRPLDPVETRLALLTDMQRQILELVAAGHSNASIAQQLHVSVKTLERNLSQAYTRLEVLGDASANARVQAAAIFLGHKRNT
jgi:DNA-binding NarL/FixJ family response regulator